MGTIVNSLTVADILYQLSSFRIETAYEQDIDYDEFNSFVVFSDKNNEIRYIWLYEPNDFINLVSDALEEKWDLVCMQNITSDNTYCIDTRYFGEPTIEHQALVEAVTVSNLGVLL